MMIEPYFATDRLKIYHGDCRDVLAAFPDESVQAVVTSPPYYGLRDYQVGGQIGLEQTPDEYINNMVEVFRKVRRVLREDGTLWLNIGDSYTTGGMGGHRTSERFHGHSDRTGDRVAKTKPPPNLKPKELIGIPWRLALALQADGWWLRQDIIWHKPNPMPESVTDRCTKAHEYIFLMTKAARYHYDADAIREENTGELPWGNKDKFKWNDDRAQGKHGKGSMFSGGTKQEYIDKYYSNGRNKRSVWTVNTKPYKDAHFATFPPKLIEPCIKAGCPEGGTVLDPFHGSGTTGQVALNHGCNYIGIELNLEYIELSLRRFKQGRLKW